MEARSGFEVQRRDFVKRGWGFLPPTFETTPTSRNLRPQHPPTTASPPAFPSPNHPPSSPPPTATVPLALAKSSAVPAPLAKAKRWWWWFLQKARKTPVKGKSSREGGPLKLPLRWSPPPLLPPMGLSQLGSTPQAPPHLHNQWLWRVGLSLNLLNLHLLQSFPCQSKKL